MSEGGVEIGALSGRIELEDKLSPVLEAATHQISAFDDAFGGLGKRMLEYTASFFTAETALKVVEEGAHLAAEALKELVIEGSHAADIETTFERITKAAGLFSDEILNHMRAATHGMVSDIDLMRDVNQMLAVGIKLTDENLTKLAEGGFVLAKKSGGDVTDALDKMSSAMTRGYVRSLLLLTGKIDLGQAEDRFAAKLDTTTAHLNEQGKQQAIAEEVLKRVAAATAKVGDEQVRLGDVVEQARASMSNFNKDLGEQISNSKVLNEALASAQQQFELAFGGKQADLVKTVARAVDDTAISVVYLFKYMGEGFQGSKILWEALKKDAVMAAEGIELAALGVDELAKGWIKLTEITTGRDLSFEVHAINVDIDRLYDNLSKANAKVDEYSQQQQSAATSAGVWDAALQKIIDRMEAAKKATQEHDEIEQKLINSFSGGAAAYNAAKKALDEQAKAHDTAAASAIAHGSAEEKAQYTMAQTAAEAEKLKKATADLKSTGDGWKGTVEAMDQTMVKAMENYLKAGASQSDLAIFYGVTAAQVRDVAKALEEETKAHALEIKQLDDSVKRWSDYNALKTQMSGTATDKTIADIERWTASEIKSHQTAKTDTADFYDFIAKMSELMQQKADKDRLLSNTNTKAYAEEQNRIAQDQYKFALEHANQYHDSDIEGYRKTAEAAKQAAEDWDRSAGTELDNLKAKAKGFHEELTLAFEVTAANWAQAGLTGGGWGALNDTIMGVPKNQIVPLLKMGFSLANAIAIINGHMDPNAWVGDRGPRVPGFKEGGIGDFKEGTLAMLHGKEAIIPLEGNMPFTGGGVTIHPGAIVLNWPVISDPRFRDEIYNVLNDVLLQRTRFIGRIS